MIGPSHPDWIPAHRPAVGACELASIRQAFESGWLGFGPLSRTFAERVAKRSGSKQAVAVSSGTAALTLALAAVGVEPGDEVIVPSLTFCGSVQAILANRARPVFCEIDPADLCVDVEDVLRRVTTRTRAVMPVHYGGQPCDLARLRAGLPGTVRIVSDGAHAFGSTQGGAPLGMGADATCYSFDALKNITCGDGGAVATDDPELAHDVEVRSQLGIDADGWTRLQRPRSWFYQVVDEGWRMHMNHVAAAIGLAQLERFESFRAQKRALARRYDAGLAGLPQVTLLRRDLETVFPFNYVIRVGAGLRDELVAWLRNRGVGTMVQFIPNHTQPAFAAHAAGLRLPRTEQVFEEIVSLPFFVEMTEAQHERVLDGVREFVRAADRQRTRHAA